MEQRAILPQLARRQHCCWSHQGPSKWRRLRHSRGVTTPEDHQCRGGCAGGWRALAWRCPRKCVQHKLRPLLALGWPMAGWFLGVCAPCTIDMLCMHNTFVVSAKPCHAGPCILCFVVVGNLLHAWRLAIRGGSRALPTRNAPHWPHPAHAVPSPCRW